MKGTTLGITFTSFSYFLLHLVALAQIHNELILKCNNAKRSNRKKIMDN